MTKTEADSLIFHQFSVEEYHRLHERGYFNGTRVELLEGYIVTKERLSPLHAVALERARDNLSPVPVGWTGRQQKPITLTDSEPEPAFAIVVGARDDYAQRHPAPGDVAFVVEMADATLLWDRVRKGRIYAKAGIPEYWIVNLAPRQLEVYTRPRAGKSPGYRGRQTFSETDTVAVTIGVNTIGPLQVRDLLPPGNRLWEAIPAPRGITRPVLESAIPNLICFRFTVEQYQQLEHEGGFGIHRMEFLDGVLVRMGSMSPPRCAALSRVRRQLEARLPQGYHFRHRFDIVLSRSQPQPDGAIAVGTLDDYYMRHPIAPEVALVVEVADNEYDQSVKQGLYALDHIPTYWLVNIPQRTLEVYTQPVGEPNPRYLRCLSLAGTESVSVTIGTQTIGPILVADLLPPA